MGAAKPRLKGSVTRPETSAWLGAAPNWPTSPPRRRSTAVAGEQGGPRGGQRPAPRLLHPEEAAQVVAEIGAERIDRGDGHDHQGDEAPLAVGLRAIEATGSEVRDDPAELAHAEER